MNEMDIYKRELDELLSAAPAHKFDEATIKDVFRTETGPVPGVYLLQTTEYHDQHSRVSGSKDDLKAHLLDYLHGKTVTAATAPIQFFRFVRSCDLRARMARYGLDHLV